MSGVLVEFFAAVLKSIYFFLEGTIYFFISRPKKNVKDQIVLITGSGSGLGRLLSVRFAKLGCVLALLDVDEKSNGETASLIREIDGRCHTFKCDLANKMDIFSTVDKVKKEVGDVDILINNAGIVSGKSLLDIPDVMIEQTFQINILAHFWLVRGFLPTMLSRNQGHIVTIASAAGFFGINCLTDYCSTKFAAVGFDETLRGEIKESNKLGVKSTCICPYYINTGMFDGVKTRFPRALPFLDGEYVADKIVKAVLTDEQLLMLPRSMYFLAALKNIFPTKVMAILTDFLQVGKDMIHFVGRAQKNL